MLKKTKFNNCKMLIGMLVIMASGLWGCSPKAPAEEFLLGGETESGSTENYESAEDSGEAGSGENTGVSGNTGNSGSPGDVEVSGETGSSVEIVGGQSLETADTVQNLSAPAMIYVHVCGAVEAPGVYCLQENARVYEAVEAAGGFRQDADQDWLNQAGTLMDGEKLQVFTREETAEMKEAGITDSKAAGTNNQTSGAESIFRDENATAADNNIAGADGTSGLVNINTASREELMTLPGIGEAKADAVLAYRETQGSFEKIEDIMKISGIKEAVFLKIKDRITV